jgi:hypothetical protein
MEQVAAQQGVADGDVALPPGGQFGEHDVMVKRGRRSTVAPGSHRAAAR